MKHKTLLAIVLFLTALLNIAKANESEPNDNKAQANTFTVNSNNKGKINPAGDQDWWKLTTPGDGKLDITLTFSSNVYMWIYLYDNDGTTIINSSVASASFTLSTEGLAAGTYYVKIACYYSGDTSSYTISNTLTQVSQANDVEPNDSKAQAIILNVNSTKTGHVGYYYQSHRDTADWYKITTSSDGFLKLSLGLTNGKIVWMILYDNDGTTVINSNAVSTSFDLNTDGLAAGTYYVKIMCYYYNNEAAPYTLKDSLFVPTQANDAEPNDNKAQAKPLQVNSSKTGHVGYYYQSHRDTADWYKITTSSDGFLKLSLGLTNGKIVWMILYDNDGTTVINSNAVSTSFDLNTDGLAAGTYYVKIMCYYYNNEAAPYTLKDSLFVPTQANDAEPNDNKAHALSLSLNSTITGHVGYYYQSHRDSADWYKITLGNDGYLKLTLTPGNSKIMWLNLYDSDGTTLINSYATSSPFTLKFDWLAAGSYFVKINCYYNSEAAPYTLTDSFFTYSNTNEIEPNDFASEANLISASGGVTGHVNFYHNVNTRDGADWFKLNYTGNGSLTLNVNSQRALSDSSYRLYAFKVYKDTAADPIFSATYSGASGDINLTSLTQGYYWIRISAYYPNEGISYSINNSFTQTSIAKIKLTTPVQPTDCSASNSLKFTCSGSEPPYTVQLYRFGLPYGSAVAVTKSKTFTNLPNGYYYATAYGNGATGTAYGTSKAVTLVPTPTNLTTTNIQSKQAKLNWTTQTCASYYSIQYRVQGTTTWSSKKTTGNVGSYVLKNLTPNTTYEWQVASADTSNGTGNTGDYSSIAGFTTSASLVADNSEEQTDNAAIVTNRIHVYPNPASTYFRIELKFSLNEKVSVSLKDAQGRVCWHILNTDVAGLNAMRIDVSKLSSGIYFLQVENNAGIQTQKITITK